MSSSIGYLLAVGFLLLLTALKNSSWRVAVNFSEGIRSIGGGVGLLGKDKQKNAPYWQDKELFSSPLFSPLQNRVQCR